MTQDSERFHAEELFKCYAEYVVRAHERIMLLEAALAECADALETAQQLTQASLQKSFALAIKISFGCTRDFRVKMWGTSSPEDKLAGDLGNVIEATSTGGRRSDFFTAEKLAPGNLGLLQQYLPHPDSCDVAKKASSFDHLVGAPKQRDRESEAERPGGLEVDKQLNFRGLLHREVRRFGARKNQAGMDTALMPPISNTTSVAHEAAGRSEFAKLVDRGHSVANGERGKPFAMACEE
jgi:hypothetical protein